MFDWLGLWNRKHDEIVITVLGGLVVIFLAWICKKVFDRLNSAQSSDRTAAPTVVTTSPQISQQFSPTINNNIQIPTPAATVNDTNTGRRNETDRKTLEQLQALLPEQDGIARLRRQQFWPKFTWTLDSILFHYLQTTSGPSHKFLDPELEDLRSHLYNTVKDLGDRVYRYSDWLQNSTTERYFWTQDNELIAEFNNRRDEVWKLAEQVCSLYDKLILTGRRKLHE